MTKSKYKILNCKEAAAYLGMSTATLGTWRHGKRELPFIRMGGSIRYLERDLIEYLDTHTQPITKSETEYVQPTNLVEKSKYVTLSHDEKIELLQTLSNTRSTDS